MVLMVLRVCFEIRLVCDWGVEVFLLSFGRVINIKEGGDLEE